LRTGTAFHQRKQLYSRAEVLLPESNAAKLSLVYLFSFNSRFWIFAYSDFAFASNGSISLSTSYSPTNALF
jgi:hypothetical protein